MSVSLHHVDIARCADETFRFGQFAVVICGNERERNKLRDTFGPVASSAVAPDTQPMRFRSEVWTAAWRFWCALPKCRVWRHSRRLQFLPCWRRVRDRVSQAHVHQRSGRSRSDWPRLRHTRPGSNCSPHHSERSGIRALLGRTARSDHSTHAQVQGLKFPVTPQ